MTDIEEVYGPFHKTDEQRHSFDRTVAYARSGGMCGAAKSGYICTEKGEHATHVANGADPVFSWPVEVE